MIIANLATYPLRRKYLNRVVAAISPQVDRLNIVLNQYDAVPVELEQYPNVVPIIPAEDLKDAGKFYPDVGAAQYVFLIDDDIIYPSDYVSTSIIRFEAIPLRNFMAGYHGSLYIRPRLLQFLRYPDLLFTYNKRLADFRSGAFHFKSELKAATVVDQIGTGTAFLRGIDMPPFEYMCTAQKFVDVRLARWCYEHGIIPVCLPRAANWIDELSFAETIHESFTKNNPPDVNAEIQTYAFKVEFRGLPVSQI